MNTLWSYFWPILAEALVIGVIAGSIAFRRRKKRHLARAAGVVIALALAALWHGPLGGAERFTTRVERDARATLNFYEMSEVTAHLHRGPLSRHLVLSGPGDDFQRNELVRTMGTLPGVGGAGWSDTAGGPPLIAEAAAAAILGFLLGLLLAYLAELHRRYNAQWNW
jgi:hypothetical protein